MAIERSEVEHIAALARLSLDEAQLPALVRQLNDILGHMELLARLDTAGVPAAASVGDAACPLRVDEGPPIPLQRPLADFAPAMRDGLFLVPRLATHESAGGGPEDALGEGDEP